MYGLLTACFYSFAALPPLIWIPLWALFLSRKSKVAGGGNSGSNGVSTVTGSIGGGGGLVEGYERGPIDASSGLKMPNGVGTNGLRSRSGSGSGRSGGGNENGNGSGLSYQSISAVEQQQLPPQPPRNSLKDSSRFDDNDDALTAAVSSSLSPTSLPVPPASILQLLRSPPVMTIVVLY